MQILLLSLLSFYASAMDRNPLDPHGPCVPQILRETSATKPRGIYNPNLSSELALIGVLALDPTLNCAAVRAMEWTETGDPAASADTVLFTSVFESPSDFHPGLRAEVTLRKSKELSIQITVPESARRVIDAHTLGRELAGVALAGIIPTETGFLIHNLQAKPPFVGAIDGHTYFLSRLYSRITRRVP